MFKFINVGALVSLRNSEAGTVDMLQSLHEEVELKSG